MSKYNIVSTIFLALLFTSLIFEGVIDFSIWWYISLVLVFLTISAIGSVVLSLQYFTPVVSKGVHGVALTFDDGPVVGKTDRVLDVLKSFKAPAAFFCIGNRLAANHELGRRINEEGHLLANHSYFHRATFDLQSSSMISKELADTDLQVATITGKRSRYFRPPYGVTNPMVAKAVQRRNYTVVGWSIRSFDTVIKDPQKLFRRVTKSLKSGDIIVFHDHGEATIQILPALLEHIRMSGLKVVRLDEMINDKPYA